MRPSKFLLVPLALMLCAAGFAQQSAVTPTSKSSPQTPAAPEVTAKPRMRRVAMIEIAGRPGFKGVAVANGFLVMAHPAASTVDVFSLAKRRVVAQVKDMKGASGVAVDASAGRVFVANTDANEIAVLSSKDWSVERRIPLKAAPDALLFVPEFNTLYASNWRHLSISVVEAGQGTAIDTVTVEGRPEYLAFDPATKQIFASLEDTREVIVLDRALKVIKRFPLVASQPTGLALDANARRLYVAVRHAVLALDADSGQELRRVAAPAGIDMLWLDAASGSLYGASADGTVALMRTGGGLAAEQEFRTDVHGHTLAFDPAKKLVYLPGGREGRSKLLILRRIEPNEAAATPQVAKK